MNYKRLCLIVAGLWLTAVGTVAGTERPVAFVSILPQKYFLRQICGDALTVEVMVAPGASPATYEPKPSQMRRLAGADLYFAIGVPFERPWLERLAGLNPELELVHTDRGIAKRFLPAHDHGRSHDHQGHAPAHDDPEPDESGASSGDRGLDPHIWLDPGLVKRQAGRIVEALQQRYPQWSDTFEANHHRFVRRLEELDDQLRRLLAGSRGEQFMVFHPSWGYFAEAYGLHQVAIEIEGKDPKPAQLQNLIAHAREQDIRVIFVQPQFSRKSAALIAREIDGEVRAIDPLAEDWAANLRRVAAAIKAGIERRGES